MIIPKLILYNSSGSTNNSPIINSNRSSSSSTPNTTLFLNMAQATPKNNNSNNNNIINGVNTNYSTGVFYNWGEKFPGKPPTFNSSIPNICYLSNGFSHTLALTESGEVYAWGDNRSHQLGVNNNTLSNSSNNNNSTLNSSNNTIHPPLKSSSGSPPQAFRESQTPILINPIAGDLKVRAISCGGCFSAAILENGLLYTWGILNEGSKYTETPTKVDLLKGVTSVSVGINHVAVVAETNTPEKKAVYTWGTNKKGQLGVVGDSITNAPRKVTLGAKALSVVCGDEFTASIVEGNEVFVWGNNKGRQIANNSDEIISIPVKPFLGKDIVELACSRSFIAARSSAGNVLVWGNNEHVCRVGENDKWITFPNKIKQIAAGLNHILALSEKGELYSMGNNDDGQLAHKEKKSTLYQPAPVAALEGRNVLSVYAWNRCSGALVEPGNFKVEISETMRRPENANTCAPLFIRKLVNYMRGDNSRVEGLFRLPGSIAREDELERRLDSNENFTLNRFEPFDAADILKRYFKTLPEPLFLESLCNKYEREILNNSDQNQRDHMILEWIAKLPKENRELLIYLLAFLEEIAYSQTKHLRNTAMAEKNLALVFAPNLLTRGVIGNDDIIEDMLKLLPTIIRQYPETEPMIIIDQAKECLRGTSGSRVAYIIDHWTRIIKERDTAKSSLFEPSVISAIINSLVDGILELKGNSPRSIGGSPLLSTSSSNLALNNSNNSNGSTTNSPISSPIQRMLGGGGSFSLNSTPVVASINRSSSVSGNSPVLYSTLSSPSLSLSSSSSSMNLLEQNRLYEQVFTLIQSPLIPVKSFIKVLTSIYELSNSNNDLFIKLMLTNKSVRTVQDNLSERMADVQNQMKEIVNLSSFKERIESINSKVEAIISDILYISDSQEYWKKTLPSIQLYSNQIQSYFKWWMEMLDKCNNESEEKLYRWKKDFDKLESEKNKLEKQLNNILSITQTQVDESVALKKEFDQWCLRNQIDQVQKKLEYTDQQVQKFNADKQYHQLKVDQFKPHLNIVTEFVQITQTSITGYLDHLSTQKDISNTSFPSFYNQYIELIFTYQHDLKQESPTPTLFTKDLANSISNQHQLLFVENVNQSKYQISLELEIKFNSVKKLVLNYLVNSK
ncbi:hypothetical protein CYY_001304 [Polysphondylium violaceum]|uniref:Rho-GAP domain-containing protein n=1 Tax=Polysphondylium violaceum TaxID=133409 RepID=A0A8J4Q0A7_9MYCE|nr:hypothetical protein CYY_001304 [Polysphondylium violaceum]